MTELGQAGIADLKVCTVPEGQTSAFSTGFSWSWCDASFLPFSQAASKQLVSPWQIQHC